MPSLNQMIRFWWKHLLLILFIIIWSLVTNFWLSTIEKMISLSVYAVIFPTLIWMITTSIIVRYKQQIIASFRRKPGSRLFEYLFFMFLFIASYYVAYLFFFMSKGMPDILEFFTIIFMFFFITFGAFAFGWLHYIERIEG